MNQVKSSNLILKQVMALMFSVLIYAAQICSTYAIEETTGNNVRNIDVLSNSITSGELECFINEAFDREMQKFNIPGAAISIVKDNHIILSKGYGYADIDNKKLVEADRTMFRIASVTKLFTANAVMQLVENKNINLNEDINNYLTDFKIKNRYSTKVTMAQLLTHTSGIDSDIIGDLSEKEAEVKPVSQFLKNRMLPVVREPGQFIQYSNYGMALSGCIVEEVSGMSCKDYITKHIFEPLEMENTNFEMNPDELAKGYKIENGVLTQQNLKGYFNLYPIGGIVSTVDDMSKFMIAHLNNGEYNKKHILTRTTSIDMHSRHAGFDSTVPGMCYGFAEGFRNGYRTIGHPGYSPDGFSTELCLLPDFNLGIFVAVNQGTNNSFPQNFVNEFIDHYFPAPADSLDDCIMAGVLDKRIEGTYRFGEYTRTTLNKGDIFGAGEDVKVIINKDKSITVHEADPFTGEKTATVATQVKPMIFKSSDGEYFAFKLNNDGEVTYMANTSNSWHGTYERISWYEGNLFQVGIFMACSVILLVEIILFIVFATRYFVMKHKHTVRVSLFVRSVNLLLGINSLLNLLFYGISLTTWGDRLRYGVPMDVRLLLCIPVITSVITIGLAVASIISWKKKTGSLLFRTNTSIAVITFLIYMWLYNYYNLLGFKY
ncbi:MAG: beta-lactamase family protein [Clostridiaceae bacterium]|nr:beta-lactamase family protein [Clostridiaceae bacterium]